MSVWIGFLLLSFLVGGFEVRRGRPVRTILLLGACVLVAFALRTYRFA